MQAPLISQGQEDSFAENGPAEVALGVTREAGLPAMLSHGHHRSASTVIWTATASDVSAFCSPKIWVQNQRAWHPQQSPSRPSSTSDMTTPAPEDQWAPPTVQRASPPLHPSQPQESMPPLAAAAPFRAPTFQVPGTASGVCVGQPLMIFMIQPSTVAL